MGGVEVLYVLTWALDGVVSFPVKAALAAGTHWIGG
jgi:hypothetical protein